MRKKLSFKLITIFIVMTAALFMTIASSYVAIDTQKQHIAITEVVAAERMNVERFTLLTLNIAQGRVLGNSVELYTKEANEIEGAIQALEHIFEELYNRQYTLIDGTVTTLRFRGAFERDLYTKIDEIVGEFELAKQLSRQLIEEEVTGNYIETLALFESINPVLLSLSDDLVVLCLEEATAKRQLSLGMQIFSITVAMLSIGVLIYLLVTDFYKPIMEIKSVLKPISLGSLSVRLKRSKEDEFQSLFNDFNYFLDHLEKTMAFEDEILEESSIEKLLGYISSQFNTFIPFSKYGILYKKSDLLHEISLVSSKVFTNSYKNNYFESALDDIKRNNPDQKLILSPIKMNRVLIGYSYFLIPERMYQPYHEDFINLIETKLSMAFYKSLLFDDLLSIVTGSLAKMAEKKDPETGNHLKRMALYSQAMAKYLSKHELYNRYVDDAFVRNIYLTAPMHDIGKVSVADSILLKPGKLTSDEFETMKGHVLAGAEILTEVNHKFSDYNITYFKMAYEIALCHHEKYDGSGYPSGLKENEIPLSARICAVADVFDALSTKRPYKEAFPLSTCYKILKEGEGTHFDPIVLNAFFDVISEIEEIYYKYIDDQV